MEQLTSPPLSAYLADFETTTSRLMRPSQAKGVVNFAALFHEVVYISDTAMGDHRLIIESFARDGHTGLFSHLRQLIEAGILCVLMRSQVVVRGKVLFGHHPTLRDNWEGWKHRDATEWAGETGFTTEIDDEVRRSYYGQMDETIEKYNARRRYDPNILRPAFRQLVLEQLGRSDSSLVRSLSDLPTEIRHRYERATRDPWFTNADLWRALRHARESREAIILHGHINQQCFADVAEAGVTGRDTTPGGSLASFNLELQRRHAMSLDVDATLHPPANLEELLERAPVRLKSGDLEMFEKLSVETIVSLRHKAKRMFELARKRIRPDKLERFRDDYLKEVGDYWNHILDTFRTMYPLRMLEARDGAIFLEDQLPSISRLWLTYGKPISAVVLRLALNGAPSVPSALSPLGPDALHRLGVVLLQKPTVGAKRLRAIVPPVEWGPDVMLGLDRSGKSQ